MIDISAGSCTAGATGFAHKDVGNYLLKQSLGQGAIIQGVNWVLILIHKNIDNTQSNLIPSWFSVTFEHYYV